MRSSPNGWTPMQRADPLAPLREFIAANMTVIAGDVAAVSQYGMRYATWCGDGLKDEGDASGYPTAPGIAVAKLVGFLEDVVRFGDNAIVLRTPVDTALDGGCLRLRFHTMRIARLRARQRP